LWRGFCGIAANAIINHAKRAAREFPAPDDPPDRAAAPDLQASEMRAIEYRAQLFLLVRRLPEVQKQVVYERFVEQRSIREIAQRLGKTEGAVKQLQLRAVQNLRAQMRAAMAKRSLALQLDEVVQWMLVSLRPRPEETPDRELASLTRVAQVLRDLPRKEFRVALKSDLQRRASMSEGKATSAAGTGEAKAKTVQYQRPGLTGITPYIIVRPAAQFIEFLKSAFEGVERMRMPAPDGSIMHAEVAIGNGAIEVSDGNEQYPTAPGAVHLYVDDPDATYARTLQAGATSFYAPTDDHPSGDRWGAVKDSFGNHWYMPSSRGWTPGPEGLRFRTAIPAPTRSAQDDSGPGSIHEAWQCTSDCEGVFDSAPAIA